MKKKGLRWIGALVVLLIALTSVWLISANAAAVTINDAKLESALKTALNTTELTASKLESLTELDLSGKGITDLTGLEKAKNLRVLSLRNNQIKDLSSLASLTLLETLDVCGNKVRSLTPLSGLNNLRVLQVTDNAVSDLSPVSALKMLQFVFCERNKLNVATGSDDMLVIETMRKRGTYVELGNLSEQKPDFEEGSTSSEGVSSSTSSSTSSDSVSSSTSSSTSSEGVSSSTSSNTSSSNVSSATPSLTVNEKSSLKLDRQNGYLTGATPGTAVAQLFADLKTNGGTLKVLKSDGTAASEKEMIGTGLQVQLLDAGGKVLEQFTVLLYGDVNGDGVIDVIDLAMMRRDIVTNGQLLKGVAFKAANLYAWHMNDASDGIIDVMDLAVIRRSIIGELTISQA